MANLNAINYGPLAPLIGRWQGEQGIDISPEKIGEERNLYREEIYFEPIGDLSNAEEQTLVCLRYHQVVTRLSAHKMIHNETGYYSWDDNNQQVIKSFSIPRGVAVTAGGVITNQDDDYLLKVSANANSTSWTISESPFMQKKAKTESYAFSMQFNENQINYSQSMLLSIFDKSFEHSDNNQLNKIIEPELAG